MENADRLVTADSGSEHESDFDEIVVSIMELMASSAPDAQRGSIPLSQLCPTEIIVEGIGDERKFPLLPITDAPTLDARCAGVDAGGGLHFHHLHRVSSRDLRGRVAALRKYMVQYEMGDLSKTGKFSSQRRHLGSNDGAHWRYIDHAITDDGPRGLSRLIYKDLIIDDEKLQIACGLQFRRPMDWMAKVDIGHGCYILLPTDPVGAKEMFSARSAPAGKTRRAALRNWVRSHWRRRRSISAEEMISVREHLRGETSFDWYGYKCSIEVSEFDLKRNDSLRNGSDIRPACSCGKSWITPDELADQIQKRLSKWINPAPASTPMPGLVDDLARFVAGLQLGGRSQRSQAEEREQRELIRRYRELSDKGSR